MIAKHHQLFVYFLERCRCKASGGVHRDISMKHKDVDGVLTCPSWSLPSAVAFW